MNTRNTRQNSRNRDQRQNSQHPTDHAATGERSAARSVAAARHAMNILAMVLMAGLSTSVAFAQVAEPVQGPTDAPTTDSPVTESPAAPVPEAPRIKSPVTAKPVELIVEDEAVQVLQKCAEAVKALKSITMKGNTGNTGGGMFEKMSQKIEGSILATRSPSDPNDWVVRVTGSGSPRASEPAIQFDCLWTKNEAQWIDHKDKKVIKRTLGGARGIPYQLPMQLRPSGLFTLDPLSAQLASKEIKMEKAADAGGTPCDVVLVSADGRRDRTRWYIAKSDHLPRKIEKVIESAIASGTSFVEFGDIQIDKEVPATSLQMVTPEGYADDENTTPATKAEKRAAAGGAAPTIVTTKPERAERSEGEPGVAVPTAAGEHVEGGEQGMPSGSPADAPTGEHAAATPAAEPVNTHLAPAFSMNDLEGKPVTLESLKGRVVVLNFWGTWSPKSKAAHAELQALTEKFKDKSVTVLAAAVREKGKDATVQHMTSHSYTFKALQDADKTAKAYKVSTYPTTIVIGPTGEIAVTVVGFTKEETFKQVETAIEAALVAK